jgi:microcystin-dependent protein
MSTPFLGQLLLASWNFATKGYALCNGQLLPINQNEALFSLLGTTYGGNGMQNFGLPNLQGRTPIGFGNGTVLGQAAGEEAHTLVAAEVPSHSHALQAATAAANIISPGGNLLAATAGAATPYTGASGLGAMNPATISDAGGSQLHENRQPFLVMNWGIALQGIFPSRS